MHAFTLVVTLVLLLVFAPSAAQANTEKVVFTVRPSSKSDASSAGVEHREEASSHGQPSSSFPPARIESLALVDPKSWYEENIAIKEEEMEDDRFHVLIARVKQPKTTLNFPGDSSN